MSLYMKMQVTRVLALKKENEELFQTLLVEYFGKSMTFEEVSLLSNKERYKFHSFIIDSYSLSKVPLDVVALAATIQRSTAGEIGLSVMTDFECKVCGKTSTWGSSAVPVFCASCSENVARRVALASASFLK